MTTIEIVPYDLRWPAVFETEADRLRGALGPLALRIDHNGSTAVPGLAAKPIIDIQVSVASLQPLAPYRDRLASIGYVHAPHADDVFCPFFHRPAGWPHTHHVHLVRSGSEEERRTLAFRDYLRDHAAARDEYEALKRKLACEFTADSAESREGYAIAKSELVERLIAAAFAAGYPG
jgi:GrpB-like predicted nucleotidyltransferase (UPF0157 family)